MRGIGAKSLRKFSLILFCLLILTYCAKIDAANSIDVVINEVAWMGTEAYFGDEWIELYNTTDQDINLTDWTLASDDDSPNFTFTSEDCSNLIIPAQGFFLLERTDDTTVSDIAADCIYTGALGDGGEELILKDTTGAIMDTANDDGGDWPAGEKDTRSSMERIDPLAPDTDDNWATNDGDIINGEDADGNPINGTPKAQNSVTNFPPVADTNGPYSCNVGDTINLDGSGSSDSDGSINKYEWDLDNDGQYDDASGANPSYSCSTAGSHIVGLKVTDDHNATDTDSTTVNVNSPPTSDFAYSPSSPTTQDNIQFTDQSTDSDGTIASWSWDFGDGSSSTTQNPTHQYTNDGTYTVTLTVTDDDGATDTTTEQITIGEPLSSGDCNGDGKITMEDANLAAEYAIGLKTPTDAQKEAADVVAPFGVIDIRDAIAIVEVAQGLRSGFD